MQCACVSVSVPVYIGVLVVYAMGCIMLWVVCHGMYICMPLLNAGPVKMQYINYKYMLKVNLSKINQKIDLLDISISTRG